MLTMMSLKVISMLVTIIISIVSYTHCFNIVSEPYYLASVPELPKKSTYFGYSVGILQEKNQAWLLVGAPRANISGIFEYEPGALFKCNLRNNTERCSNMDLTTKNRYPGKLFRRSSWIGASLDIDLHGNIIVCAPRTHKQLSDYPTEYITNGICYSVQVDGPKFSAKFVDLLSDRNRQVSSYNGGLFYHYALGQLGMSIHLTNDPENQSLLVGAPGIFNWHGSVAWAKLGELGSPGGRNKRQSNTNYIIQTIPHPAYTKVITDSDLFGYSVTSGTFKNPRDTHFVSGAPRGKGGYGMVLVFKIGEYETKPLSILDELRGTQLGEYFGSAVAAPDFNGDGYSDLVVGAPLHSVENNADAGCVYVYTNNIEEPGKLIRRTQLFGDIMTGARFGTAIGMPGDLNYDGFQDILVGAPYENDNEGAVYVFMGTEDGVRTQYSQKLTPETMNKKELKGLGISFSRASDLDNNKYPDFAVGSYLSDNTVVMVTRPVIKVNGTIKSQPAKLNYDEIEFTVVPCVSYSGIGVPDNFKVTAHIGLSQESDGTITASFKENGATEIDVELNATGNQTTCRKISVGLSSEQKDAQKSIIIKLEFTINDENGTGPVMDPYAVIPTPYVLAFITGCGDDNICHTNLMVLAVLKDLSPHQPILIGNVNKVTLEVDVRNMNDPAFLPNLTMVIPRNVKMFPSRHICTTDKIKRKENTTIVCQLTNPLVKDTTYRLDFDFDLSFLDDTSKDLYFELVVSSAANFEDKPEDNKYNLTIPVLKEAKIKIEGSSNPEQYSYELEDEYSLKFLGEIELQHRFTVFKEEITPVARVRIVMEFPYEYVKEGIKYTLMSLLNHELEFHQNSGKCTVKKEDLEDDDVKMKTNLIHLKNSETLNILNCSSNHFRCAKIICDVGPWKKNFDASSMTAFFNLNMSALENVISLMEGATLQSDVQAEITSLENFDGFKGTSYAMYTLETTLQPGALPAQTLAWWIYLLAILGGLLLLILTSYILYRLGFFRRKKMEEMQAQKAALIKQNSQSDQTQGNDGVL